MLYVLMLDLNNRQMMLDFGSLKDLCDWDVDGCMVMVTYNPVYGVRISIREPEQARHHRRWRGKHGT